jgi:NADH dehydrogenase
MAAERGAMTDPSVKKEPHVVIVGAGFGGLTAAKALADAPVRVTVVDRTNHHLFQPLLYQVATAGLSPADIASPIRHVLRHQPNTSVLLDEVVDIDLANRTVLLREESTLPYDYLILAAGAGNHYFGHDEWERYAPGLKSLDDAVEIRRRVLVAFEAAEREPSPEARCKLLTMVVIGAGPTGVEMAGALAELSRYVLAKDFRVIDPTQTRVVLIEGGPAVLASFDPSLQARARAQLEELGVEVRTGARVTNIDADGVVLGDERIASATVVWAAGVHAAPLAAKLGLPVDRGGRVRVESDCSLPGHREVFAIGDMVVFEQDGRPLPGVSPVAMQQARSVVKNIVREIQGSPRTPFRYFDKGTMATIGRSRAVAETRGLRLSGLMAWLAWLLVHIWYLIGFRNRFMVMFSWMWSYVTYGRGARLITGDRLEAGAPHTLPAPAPALSARPAGDGAKQPVHAQRAE